MIKMNLIILVLLSALTCSSPSTSAEDHSAAVEPPNYSSVMDSALAYCHESTLDTSFMILIDMDIHSGRERLFVYDFSRDSIVDSGLVSHGCCDGSWGMDESKDSPLFKNVAESHCSSLGKYRIGARGWSNWGIHVNYKLHGLENLNDKAYERYIVLHSWEMVSDEEVYPDGTPEGWGCPAVSNALMKRLDERLSTSKDVLLWIIKS